jgi:colicin import membrane protein
MARKLKVFQTSLGFYDLAIAVPSMKAALEAWGADSNLFHQGAASESQNAQIIAATMAKPGIILKRPVGSNGPFRENAGLPASLPGANNPGPKDGPAKPTKVRGRPTTESGGRKAALAFEKERTRRESDRRKEEAAGDKERQRRQRAVAKAEAALEAATNEHSKRAAALDTQRDAIENKSVAEDARWEKQRTKLRAALRRASE